MRALFTNESVSFMQRPSVLYGIEHAYIIETIVCFIIKWRAAQFSADRCKFFDTFCFFLALDDAVEPLFDQCQSNMVLNMLPLCRNKSFGHTNSIMKPALSRVLICTIAELSCNRDNLLKLSVYNTCLQW